MRASRNRLSDALGSLEGEILFRVLLLCLFLVTEQLHPFRRVIRKEEFWLLDNPRTPSYYPTWMLTSSGFFVPLLTIYSLSYCRADKEGAVKAWLAFTFSALFTAVVTNLVKNVVGRPRPDFMNRCFPNGIPQSPFADDDGITLACDGDQDVIREGRKSFPSGHSSIMFSSIGFLTFYLAQKLRVYGPLGRSEAWRLALTSVPFLYSLLVALSRTCDYHHHWQDVTVGSALGFFVAYASFRQYLGKDANPRHLDRKTSFADEVEEAAPTEAAAAARCADCQRLLEMTDSKRKDGVLLTV